MNGSEASWAWATVKAEQEEERKAHRVSMVEPMAEETPKVRAMVPRDYASCPLIVTQRFDLTMIDLTEDGARIVVRRLCRPDAMDLVRHHGAVVAANDERSQATIERELQLDPAPRPLLRYGTQLLVMQAIKWNDVRWFLVTYESDGEGVLPHEVEAPP